MCVCVCLSVCPYICVYARKLMHISVSCVLNLVCTFHSAMDGCGRLWDLRSGKCLLLMDGHQSGVLGIDFSPNGYVCNVCPVAMPMVMCVCVCVCCVCVSVYLCPCVCAWLDVCLHTHAFVYVYV